MLSAKEQSLLDALAPEACARGVSIVTIEIVGASRSPVIRIYIDTDGGVTFNELTEAQDWMGKMLDEIDPFPGAYVLEVSSPGIDRPLRTPEHFQAAIGQKAKIKAVRSLEGRKHFKGTIADASPDVVVIEADGERFTLAYEDISKANIIGTIEF